MYLRVITALTLFLVAGITTAVEPVPEKVVVLTFDDAVTSHFDVARPLLKEYGFGATFFISEGFEFRDDKTNYLTWEQVTQLHNDGFEIGNHTRDHMAVTSDTVGQLSEQLAAIEIAVQESGHSETDFFRLSGKRLSHPKRGPFFENTGFFLRAAADVLNIPTKKEKGLPMSLALITLS